MTFDHWLTIGCTLLSFPLAVVGSLVTPWVQERLSHVSRRVSERRLNRISREFKFCLELCGDSLFRETFIARATVLITVSFVAATAGYLIFLCLFAYLDFISGFTTAAKLTLSQGAEALITIGLGILVLTLLVACTLLFAKFMRTMRNVGRMPIYRAEVEQLLGPTRFSEVLAEAAAQHSPTDVSVDAA